MTDYFDQVEHELRAAVRRQAHRPWYVRLRQRRHFRAAAVVVACLVVAGPALAAAGVFQTGTPVGASVLAQPNAFEGVAIPGSVHLLSLRVPDPAGGPPWVLRALKTTRGLECLQLGRLVDGRIGVIGENGAFHNDGRFHPLSANAFEFTFNCGTLDGDGHSFANDIMYGFPASGLENANTSDGGCYPPQSTPPHLKIRRLRNIRQSRPVCPAGSLRDVYFGMLGPDATSVTYTTANGRRASTPTAGPDGAYLIVLRHTSSQSGESGGPTLTDFATNPIRDVSYTTGRNCTLPDPQALAQDLVHSSARYTASLRARFPTLAKLEAIRTVLTPAERAALEKILKTAAYRRWIRTQGQAFERQRSCPAVGYVAPRTRLVTSAQVRTPISARLETANAYCVSPAEVVQPCGTVVPPGSRRVALPFAAKNNDLLVVTWRTRVAVSDQDSHYEVYTTATATAGRDGCGTGTGFGPTETDFKAGQLVTYTSWMQKRCPGVSHGRVVFVQDTGPAGSIPVPAQSGEGPDIPVGNFTVDVP
jgi:hypothetical protein